MKNSSKLLQDSNLPYIRFSVNRYGRNKNWDFKVLNSQFELFEGTLDELRHHVLQGYAICPAWLKGGYRDIKNFLGTELLIVDVDNSKPKLGQEGKPIKAAGKVVKEYDPVLTIPQAIAHPFIQKYCCYAYTSCSHTPQWHRFRLVFRLPQWVTDPKVAKTLIKMLAAEIPGIDTAATSPVNIFYGNTQAQEVGNV